MVSTEAAAAKLLDFNQPVDVPLLDATVAAFYAATSPQEVGGVTTAHPTPTTQHGGTWGHSAHTRRRK